MIAQTPFTIHDLEHLPKYEGYRYEIIDGELHVSSQPHWQHQGTSDEIVIALGTWDPTRSHGRLISAPGIIFASDQAVAPDLVWISRERLPHVVGDDGKLHAAPDLVVEILSPGHDNEKRDQEIKLKLYSRQGVREYWIVDWRAQTVAIYRRENAVLQLAATLAAEDTLTSPLLPGFARPVHKLCAPGI